MDMVKGKVAIVTGASSGIGRACFEVLAKNGAKVVGVSRTQSKLDDALAAVKQAGGEGVVVAGDLGDPETSEKVVKAAKENYGRIDIVVNAAGVGYSLSETLPGSMNDVATTTDANWRAVMRINLDASFYLARAVIPVMQAQKSGSFVNVGSIFGLAGNKDAHTYTTAKAAMINLTRSMCVAYAGDGIRCNCVAPGYVDTPMIASVVHVFEDDAVAEALSPMKRAGTPEEIANCCMFLASDLSSYCNGAVLAVDGGTTARV